MMGGKELVRLMRREGITIRDLARRMQITQRRIREVREMGLVGSLRGPSAATQKTPPSQMMIQDAHEECKALAERRLTDSLRAHNLLLESSASQLPS